MFVGGDSLECGSDVGNLDCPARRFKNFSEGFLCLWAANAFKDINQSQPQRRRRDEGQSNVRSSAGSEVPRIEAVPFVPLIRARRPSPYFLSFRTFGDDAHLRVSAQQPRGVCAELDLPAREETA